MTILYNEIDPYAAEWPWLDHVQNDLEASLYAVRAAVGAGIGGE